MQELLTHLENGVQTITLNRPSVFNSFNRTMALALQLELDNCALDNRIRAVVITGQGKAFCAGQDLAEATDPNGPELQKIVREHYNPIILKLRSLEKPIIAAVNGVAAGAGANLALACDIVIAKESASFIQAFSKIGLIPDSGGTFMLPRLVGLQKATALMLTGEKVGAKAAEQMNMIYKAIGDEEFEHFIQEFSSNIAQMPTKGLGLTKNAINSALFNDLSTQLKVEEQMQTKAGKTNDFKEGVAAFLEKRQAIFKGN